MGFLAPLAVLGASAAGAVGSAAAGIGSAVGGGLAALGTAAGTGGSVLGGLSAVSSLASTGMGIAGALNPPKPPAPMMAPPVQAIPNPPRTSNSSLAALAVPNGMENFGAPKSGQVKTLLGQ